MRLLAKAASKQFINMLGDIAPSAIAYPDESWKLTHLLIWPFVGADEGAEQLQGTGSLILAEPADEQLQSLPSRHEGSLPSTD